MLLKLCIITTYYGNVYTLIQVDVCVCSSVCLTKRHMVGKAWQLIGECSKAEHVEIKIQKKLILKC